jgi:hypothetical protein
MNEVTRCGNDAAGYLVCETQTWYSRLAEWLAQPTNATALLLTVALVALAVCLQRFHRDL